MSGGQKKETEPNNNRGGLFKTRILGVLEKPYTPRPDLRKCLRETANEGGVDMLGPCFVCQLRVFVKGKRS